MRKQGYRILEKRAKFKKGLQRKFIVKAKQQSGLTWIDLANKLNVSEYTARVDWGTERTTIPLSYAKHLLAICRFEEWETIKKEWIVKILPKNWGQKASGELNKKTIRIPKKSEELAELFGVILGDGHVSAKSLVITGN